MLGKHSDTDGWKGEYVKVHFTDGTVQTCTKSDGSAILLDDYQSATLECKEEEVGVAKLSRTRRKCVTSLLHVLYRTRITFMFETAK